MLSRLKVLGSIKGYPLFAVILFAMGTGVSITMPYLSLYCTQIIGLSTSQFGILMSLNSIVSVFISFTIAKYSDHSLERKWIIVGALICMAVTFQIYLNVHAYWLLLLIVPLLTGAGSPGVPQMYAYVHESAEESKVTNKTFTISSLRSMISLGVLFGPLLGSIILVKLGYSYMFVTTSCVFQFNMILIILFLRRRPPKLHAKNERPKSNLTWVRNRSILMPFIAFVCLFLVNVYNGSIVPLFIVDELLGSSHDIGLIFSLCAGLEIPLMLWLGSLAKRIPNHTIIMVGAGMSFLYFVTLLFSTAPWQIVIAQFLQAAYVAIVMGNGLSYFTTIMPDSPGLATTIYSNSTVIGSLVGNLSGGVVAQWFGYRSVFAVGIGVVFIAFAFLWGSRVKKYA